MHRAFFPSQTGRAHLLLLSKTPGEAGGAIGVLTLEGEYLFYLVFWSHRLKLTSHQI